MSSSELVFYATDLPDWGGALSACIRLGARAKVLADAGEDPYVIAAVLAEEGRLGGVCLRRRVQPVRRRSCAVRRARHAPPRLLRGHRSTSRR